MWFNINLLNLILIPLWSVDLQARHRQSLVNEKPLVIHQRKGLEVQYHLRNDAHMGGLSSWVSVDPVHRRLWDIRQDLNNRNTKMKNKPHSSSPCSEKEDDPCLTSHRRSALQSCPSRRTPSPPAWPRSPQKPSLLGFQSRRPTLPCDAWPSGLWLHWLLKESIMVKSSSGVKYVLTYSLLLSRLGNGS